MKHSSVNSSKVGASTAGPWFVDVKNGKRSVTIRAGKTGLISIASVSANVDREANARLIASAPELAEALRAFVESDGIVNYDSQICWGCETAKNLDAHSAGCLVGISKALLAKL